LEKFRCSIVNVKGVAFRHFLKIISYGYFIKCLVLTDSDANKKTEERADSLQADFLSIKSIKVCKTVLSTFEKDIIESNKNGEGKNTLFRALVATRPVKGKELEDKVGAKDINVEEFFQNIEGYKAEFAFNLAESLKENQKGFNIPAYILSGFNHIMDKHE
jgi:predicted ATP-dependent endonuclease of OLD family